MGCLATGSWRLAPLESGFAMELDPGLAVPGDHIEPLWEGNQLLEVAEDCIELTPVLMLVVPMDRINAKFTVVLILMLVILMDHKETLLAL